MTNPTELPNEKKARVIASHVQNINLHTNTMEFDLVETEIEYKIKKALDEKDAESQRLVEEACRDLWKQFESQAHEAYNICKTMQDDERVGTIPFEYFKGKLEGIRHCFDIMMSLTQPKD